MHLRMMRGQSCTVTFGKTCNTMPFAKPQKRHIDHLKFIKKNKKKMESWCQSFIHWYHWWCVHQMRMLQSVTMITVIHTLIWLWCVRQMRMVQSGIMIPVIHTLILLWLVHQMRKWNKSFFMHLYYCGMCVKCVWFKVDYVWFKVELW